MRKKVFQPDSTVADSLEVALLIYIALDESLGDLDKKEYAPIVNLEYRADSATGGEQIHDENLLLRWLLERFSSVQSVDTREGGDAETEPMTTPFYAKMKGWDVRGTHTYDEWDVKVSDYKPEWVTVNEIVPTSGTTKFYDEIVQRYRNEILLIRRAFQLMKPETFRKLRAELDGEEVDFDALITALTERRCGINPSDRLYIRRDKRERNVATLFLVDVSVSTQRRIGEQVGYGKRILDVEKEALVIMIQALESIGDKYAIYAFSGETRSDVEVYAIKDFDEVLSDEVKQRIEVLEPVFNTRLGAAIRHASTKLKQVEANTKVMVLLSDGEPYDVGLEDKYQGQVAEQDTKMAIHEGKAAGLHFFCITVDQEAKEYLDAIFSEVGYTIIDNAMILPERLPMLYKRITT